MALPTNRADFKEYCLRKLGKPVIEINVDDTQVEDRIDEALQYYMDYHYDGSHLTYVKHKVTAQDKANGYITLPEEIIGVVRILPLDSALGGSGMTNIKYQFVLNNANDLYSGGLVNYVLSMQTISMFNEYFAGQKPIRFNRHMDRVFIDTDWNAIPVDSYIVIEAYLGLNGATYSDVWKDRWLQNYATILIQESWGRNLTKFVGMQLPGGVQFNGEQILQEAKEERLRLEEEMINSFSIPVVNFIG